MSGQGAVRLTAGEIVALGNAVTMDEAGVAVGFDHTAVEAIVAARVASALDDAAAHLLSKAVIEADIAGGGRMTTRGAAIWDCAAWLREECARDYAAPVPPADETEPQAGAGGVGGGGL